MSEASTTIEQAPVTKESLLREGDERLGPPKTEKERRLRGLAADLWLHIDRHAKENKGAPENTSRIKRFTRKMLHFPQKIR